MAFSQGVGVFRADPIEAIDQAMRNSIEGRKSIDSLPANESRKRGSVSSAAKNTAVTVALGSRPCHKRGFPLRSAAPAVPAGALIPTISRVRRSEHGIRSGKRSDQGRSQDVRTGTRASFCARR
jgi:hypothetical protein